MMLNRLPGQGPKFQKIPVMLPRGKVETKVAALLLLCCLKVVASSEPDSDSGPNETVEPWDSKVRVVEFDGFWRFLDRHPLILMEFYAPW